MAIISSGDFSRRMNRRKWQGRAFHALCLLAISVALGMLAVLLVYIGVKGASGVDWDFLTSFASRHPDQAGIKAALLGTIYVISITSVVAFTLGVGTAIYLEEYTARNNRLARLAKLNIANLAGVPSIVYGLLGLAIFVRGMHMGQSVLAGGVTLVLLVLPIIIVAAGEALRAVPASTREGAFALGATRWQIFRKVPGPASLPFLFSGIKIAITVSVIGAVIGEWVGSSEGLGYLAIRSKSQFLSERVYATVVLLSLMGIVLFLMAGAAERMLLPWYHNERRRRTAGDN